jgi:hypothetical protein
MPTIHWHQTLWYGHNSRGSRDALALLWVPHIHLLNTQKYLLQAWLWLGAGTIAMHHDSWLAIGMTNKIIRILGPFLNLVEDSIPEKQGVLLNMTVAKDAKGRSYSTRIN